jgi:hypothetical protein
MQREYRLARQKWKEEKREFLEAEIADTTEQYQLLKAKCTAWRFQYCWPVSLKPGPSNYPWDEWKRTETHYAPK